MDLQRTYIQPVNMFLRNHHCADKSICKLKLTEINCRPPGLCSVDSCKQNRSNRLTVVTRSSCLPRRKTVLPRLSLHLSSSFAALATQQQPNKYSTCFNSFFTFFEWENVSIVSCLTLVSWLGATTGSASDQRSEGCGFEAY